jgi:hypothetical protein
VRGTLEAGEGQLSPEAAAEVYLSKLSVGTEAGLLPVLAEDREEELLAQWRAYQAEMQRTDPPPSKLEYDYNDVTKTSEHEAVLAVELYPVWWNHGSGGTSMHGPRHAWQIVAREDNGWRVYSVNPYQWCGGYVRADACK